jgi:ribonuclease P protein component
MLPKTQRLTRNRIESLLKKGRKSGTNFFTVKYLVNNRASSRFCIVVSTKIYPKAVDRNRLRRQIYEILRLHPRLPPTPSDLIVIAKAPLTKLKFQDLAQTFIHSLQNLTFHS